LQYSLCVNRCFSIKISIYAYHYYKIYKNSIKIHTKYKDANGHTF
jgi:hypothetical protein